MPPRPLSHASARVLEFDALLDVLRGYATSPLGQKLITDLAPSFVSCLLASAIMLLTGIWMGFQVPLMMALVSVVAAARLLAAVGPGRFLGRVEASIRAFVA